MQGGTVRSDVYKPQHSVSSKESLIYQLFYLVSVLLDADNS